MAKRVSIKQKRKEAPEWVFPWQRLDRAPLTKFLSITMVAAVFALFFSTVRIRVSPPVAWAASKATVIHMGDQAEGRALTLRAKEGGPFPSRFEPSAWDGTVALERAAFEAARWTPPPYVPMLRELPELPSPPPTPAESPGAILPKRWQSHPATHTSADFQLSPVLIPLSGITPAALPDPLPPFCGSLEMATRDLAAEPGRFLIHLAAPGHVVDCVSLAGGDDKAGLLVWLRSLTFQPAPAHPSRWAVIAVGLTNQPANGPVAR